MCELLLIGTHGSPDVDVEQLDELLLMLEGERAVGCVPQSLRACASRCLFRTPM